MTWHRVLGAKTAFLELPQIQRLLAIPSNISALVSIPARTLRALMALTGLTCNLHSHPLPTAQELQVALPWAPRPCLGYAVGVSVSSPVSCPVF